MRIKISYARFELPFLKQKDGSGDFEEETENADGQDQDIEFFENKLPKNAVFIGQIDDEVSNFTSWKIEDHYFIIPWQEDKYEWAMFRISWDDNWGCFGWTSDARIKGVLDRNEAARRMLKGLFAKWKYDLRKREYAAHRNLIAEI